jgi:hypothetical protein
VERNKDGGYDAPTEYFTEPISALGNDDPVTEEATYWGTGHLSKSENKRRIKEWSETVEAANSFKNSMNYKKAESGRVAPK